MSVDPKIHKQNMGLQIMSFFDVLIEDGQFSSYHFIVGILYIFIGFG